MFLEKEDERYIRDAVRGWKVIMPYKDTDCKFLFAIILLPLQHLLAPDVRVGATPQTVFLPSPQSLKGRPAKACSAWCWQTLKAQLS